MVHPIRQFRRIFRGFIALGISLAGLAAAAGAPPAQVKPLPLLLVSIDGFMPSYLFAPEYAALKLATLRSYLTQGSYAEGVSNVVPSLTYPAHTTLLTGVPPAVHGIENNVRLDPQLLAMDDWYWFAEDIKAPTLWHAAAQRGLTSVNVDWPVSVGAPVTINLPQYWHQRPELGRRLFRALSGEARRYLDDAAKRLGLYPHNTWDVASDTTRAAYVNDLVSRYKPDLLTAYFASIDELSHHHAPGSPEVREALQSLDALLAGIEKTAAKTYPQGFRIALVSDHGFVMAEQEIRLNAWLKELGLITTDAQGQVREQGAVAWHAEGSAAIMLKDPHDLPTYNKIAAALAHLAAQHQEAIARIISGDQLKALGGFAGASFVVAAREHYKFTWSHQLPVIGAKAAYPATHGYLPEDRRMDAVFLLKGPGIPAGKNLGRIAMIDIAPTLAPLIGVSLPEVSGHNVLAAH